MAREQKASLMNPRTNNEGPHVFQSSSWNQINWSRIGRAVDFYSSKGFEYVEVPWIIDDKHVKATYPKDVPETHAFQTKLGTIIGSAEQSFIHLADKGFIKEERLFVTTTPCFRDYQPDDALHRTYFMKVELFSSKKSVTANKLMIIAGEFFAKEGLLIQAKKTKIGFDWEMDHIEVGSYGNRKWKNLSWSYGTGLAEPRFSQALQRQAVLHGQFPFSDLIRRVENLEE